MLLYRTLTQHKQIEHENRDSNRPEFRNYNFHFTSKEMENDINELLAERDYWRERCQVHANMVSQLAEKLERKEALNAELLEALEKLLMSAEYSRYVQKSATLEPSMIRAKVLINKAKAQ